MIDEIMEGVISTSIKDGIIANILENGIKELIQMDISYLSPRIRYDYKGLCMDFYSVDTWDMMDKGMSVSDCILHCRAISIGLIDAAKEL